MAAVFIIVLCNFKHEFGSALSLATQYNPLTMNNHSSRAHSFNKANNFKEFWVILLLT